MPQDVLTPAAAATQAQTDDRRTHRRKAGKAVVHIARERDPARQRFPASLLNISIGGIGLVTSVRIEPNEQVRVSLKNEIQRISKEVRGTVRWMSPAGENEFRLGIELSPRMSPNDLMSLTRVVANFGTGTEKVWM